MDDAKDQDSNRNGNSANTTSVAAAAAAATPTNTATGAPVGTATEPVDSIAATEPQQPVGPSVTSDRQEIDREEAPTTVRDSRMSARTSTPGAVRCNGNSQTTAVAKQSTKGLRGHGRRSSSQEEVDPVLTANNNNSALQRGLARTAEELEAKRQARNHGTSGITPSVVAAEAPSGGTTAPTKAGLRRTSADIQVKQNLGRPSGGTVVGARRTSDLNDSQTRGLRQSAAAIEAKQTIGSSGATGEPRNNPAVVDATVNADNICVTKKDHGNGSRSGLRFFSKGTTLWDDTTALTEQDPPATTSSSNPTTSSTGRGPQQVQPTTSSSLSNPSSAGQGPLTAQTVPGATHVPGNGQQPVPMAAPTSNTNPQDEDDSGDSTTASVIPDTRHTSNDGLAVASVVREPSQLELGQAQEVDPAELERRAVKAAKERQCRRIGYCIILVAVAVVAASVIAVQSGPSPQPIHQTPPTASSTSAPTVFSPLMGEIDKLLIGNQTYSTLTRVDLSGKGLTGPIPSELGQLVPNLTYLDLSDNYVTGPIPSELGLMSNLGQLSLSGNSLTGLIPSELGLLTALLYELYW